MLIIAVYSVGRDASKANVWGTDGHAMQVTHVMFLSFLKKFGTPARGSVSLDGVIFRMYLMFNLSKYCGVTHTATASLVKISQLFTKVNSILLARTQMSPFWTARLVARQDIKTVKSKKEKLPPFLDHPKRADIYAVNVRVLRMSSHMCVY